MLMVNGLSDQRRRNSTAPSTTRDAQYDSANNTPRDVYASGTASAKPTATSDVKGRKFDVGTVSSVSNVGGSQVVELDRWTATGTSDSTLAEKGLKVLAHKGSRFTNQNTSKTYTAPVAPGARLVVNTCVADASGDLGMTSQPISASAWLAKPDRAAVLLVSYDSAGVIIRLDTDPRCPG